MNTKPKDEFENFIDALVDELIATPDDQVLNGLDSATVQAEGLRLLQAAKAQVGRDRLLAAKAGLEAVKKRSPMAVENISPEEARQFIAKATNDSRYTLAARNLGELSDDEVLQLYRKLKTLEAGAPGDAA